MAFSGKYELESQENYEFLEAIGFDNAKTDIKVITEVLQEGDDFTWSQTTFTMEGGKIAISFPQYHIYIYTHTAQKNKGNT
uniref:Cytosolic fatty-acid binding proteins domain-containing protein n=1 Tax=Salmo trutta TaxID=8032 RepID=A0A674BRE4_SALTR